MCGGDHTVPFSESGSDNGAGSGAGTGSGRDTDFTPRTGQSFDVGTRSVAVEGAPVADARGSDIRAVLPFDIDSDGDRDALLVLVGSDGAVSVALARRNASAFDAPTELGEALEASPGCTVTEAAIETVASGYGVARITRSCAEGAEEQRAFAIVSLEPEPRLRERMTLLPARGRAPYDVAVAIRAADHDEDGLVDVVLDVDVTVPDVTEPAHASIAWLDRPGGLARDTAEPEASLSALADAARDALASDVDGALASARRALALHAVLCREGPGPRLRFGPTEGLPCRASDGAGRAAAVEAAALARLGRVFPALDAWNALGSTAYQVPERDRRQAERALGQMQATSNLTRIRRAGGVDPAGH